MTLALAVFVPNLFGRAGDDQKSIFATPQNPALLCRTVDRTTFDALISGRKQLVAVVKSYDPQGSKSGGFKVSMAGTDADTRHVVSRFGLFPNKPFKAKSERDYQRFLVPLAKFARKLAYSEDLCVEIAFESQSGFAAGAQAEVAIEIVEQNK